ncbi:MAG TPA: HAD family acid phosphatase [Candidatus Saccharimonadales bacterium]|nr:HAD family acid phosphatase [Candidatus Saccharimonadales bacterium]
MNKTTVVCVDLDGTVSDDLSRQHLKPPKGSAHHHWRTFHQACMYDTPLASTVLLLQALRLSHQIHFVSDRFVEMREVTERWLKAHSIPYDALRLYEFHDRPVKNEVYKSRYIQQLIKQDLRPVLFIEDEGYIADYIETATGVPVLCVNQRYALRP